MESRKTEITGNRPTSAKAADLALIRRVQHGDRSAFDLLVIKYQHRILKLVMRYVRDPSEALDTEILSLALLKKEVMRECAKLTI